MTTGSYPVGRLVVSAAGVETGLQVRAARAAVLRASRPPQDLLEGAPLDVDLPDDLRERHPGALAPGHRARDCGPEGRFQDGSGIEHGGHDDKMIMNMNFIFK
jgi:hypothetical protein